jgi:hypothetical protein
LYREIAQVAALIDGETVVAEVENAVGALY